MSELKDYSILDIEAIDDERLEKSESGKIHETRVYIKSEADKVIAEKDEKIDELEERIDELQKATDSAWSKVNAMYDELRHHKYKRCLWLASWCACRSTSWVLDPADEVLHKSDLWWKWKLRWLELAEKFKPNNTTAQQGKG